MKLRGVVLAGSVMVMAGCSRTDSGEQAAANNVETSVPAKKHPTYCFFKDAETKGWRASRDGAGNVVVTGKAHVKDARYQAVINESEISGEHATSWLTISQNGGYAAPENWWDVSSPIPDSSAVKAVTIQCGKKVVAELSVPT